MRVLHVAEKPSVAREIVKHLSDTPATASGGRGMQSWRFPFSNFDNTASCEFIVTAVRGHLMEIDFDATYKSWTQTSPSDLFHARIVQRVNPTMHELERGLIDFARVCQTLVLWLDCDREGEAIAFEVLEVCRLGNPNLRIFRATFSALTRADIRRALSQLAAPNRNLSEAVLARSEIDLRVGAAFTRFLSLRYRARLGLTSIVSYGPCQFPTLGLVVSRWERLVAFISEPFWTLDLSVECPPEQAVPLNWSRDRLYDELVTNVMYASLAESLVDSDGLVRIASLTEKAINKWRPIPLNTVELCKLASTRLHMASHRTMQLAESLYTKGILSYPRTETDIYHPTMDIRGTLSLQRTHSVWGTYIDNLLSSGRFTTPREGKRDDKAHPPIHPCKAVELGTLEHDEARLYDLIARHFMGQCSPDAKGQLTRLEVTINDERFAADGLKITERNFLDIYTYERWSSSSFTLPVFWREGTLIPVREFKISRGQTSPPSLLTEAELISLMDTHGIGTDATMHEHIRTVQERNYVVKTHDNKFQPTSLGAALITGFKAYTHAASLAEPTLRSGMESEIAAIADGRSTRSAFLTRYAADLRNIYLSISDNPVPLDTQLAVLPATGTFVSNQGGPPPSPPQPPAGNYRGSNRGGAGRGRATFRRGTRGGARGGRYSRVRRN
jgi:DNA topoisomerase-3